MNDLPRVLQNEIWEYVRGDRAYWRQRHQELVTDELAIVIELAEFHRAQMLREILKVELLIKSAKTCKSVKETGRFDWTVHVVAFMKHQHRVHGQLFADCDDEFDIKNDQWYSWASS